MEKTIKYCRATTTYNWYVFGFCFKSTTQPRNKAVICYDKEKVLHKRCKMYVIEAPENVKDLLLSNDPGSVVVAKSILNEIAKENKKLINYE